MTLSIAAWDETTGQLGAIIASSSPSVASRCLHWRPGVGIALSQNITDPRLGPRMLALIADGVAVNAALDATVHSTPYIRYRQLALIDTGGNTGLYSGAGVLGCFASAEGRHCVAAGNLLANESVPGAMVSGLEAAQGSFGSRLLAALAAGIAAGGEAGPVHSAGLLLGGKPSWPLAELRIDWDDDPVAKMQAGWIVYEPQIEDYVTRAYNPQDAPAYGVPGDPR
ncbi:MAG: DUF1028 domain-containing protein [Gammaproteobacteria bacterium]|jgi:uncharacterized Ntn-hydrolase superfamily protein|nr:DUF1028 domain-containing protein [Gammaproteobacteria bacterium]